MRRVLLTALVLAATTTVAFADASIQPVDPAPFRKLNCDEIATRIQALNRPIGDDSSTIAGFKRAHNPVLFALTGFGSRTSEYNDMLAQARGERNALIAVAVEKDCASKRLVPMR